MKQSFNAPLLPIDSSKIHYHVFLDELLDATSKLEVYKEKLNDSKVSKNWILPTLQQKEAVASTKLEGTQATLDGILINQIEPKSDDPNINEAVNYFTASMRGLEALKKDGFSKNLLCDLHRILLSGNVRVRENSIIGDYRVTQNYVGLIGGTHEITYIPPKPEDVDRLMDNLILYMNSPLDKYQPLIRTAIVHAQMLTIHPFDDGNGRVGRILIPLYLFSQQQISLPCFFISEALESDKFKYYRLLNETREKENWDEWIKFFLETVSKQCEKYIYILGQINKMYEEHLSLAKQAIRNNAISDIIDTIYKYPILNTAIVERETNIPLATINRYMNTLVDKHLLYTDGKKRHKTFFCYELLDIIRI